MPRRRKWRFHEQHVHRHFICVSTDIEHGHLLAVDPRAQGVLAAPVICIIPAMA
jgi:hypothetical protein